MKAMCSLFAVLSIAVLAPVALHAQQTGFSVEAQVGGVIPTGDFADFATAGFGFGVNAAYRVFPMVDVYAGYSWQRFGADDDEEFGAVDVDIDDSGFAFGGRLHVPAVPSLNPWIRAGVILHQLKLSGTEGGVSASFTSDREAGFEVGAGIGFPVAPKISLSPAVIFRSYKPSFDGETSDESLTYVGLYIGGRISL